VSPTLVVLLVRDRNRPCRHQRTTHRYGGLRITENSLHSLSTGLVRRLSSWAWCGNASTELLQCICRNSHPSRKRPSSSSTVAVCTHRLDAWMRPADRSTDVNRTTEFCALWTDSMEQFAISDARQRHSLSLNTFRRNSSDINERR